MITNAILDQVQTIGKGRRVCIWNKALTEAGLGAGTRITVTASGNLGVLAVAADPDGKRKVSRVMNHGNALPVIDLKENKSLVFSFLGAPGDKVRVQVYAAAGESRPASVMVTRV
jgi:3-dehydroquinate synthase class II